MHSLRNQRTDSILQNASRTFKSCSLNSRHLNKLDVFNAFLHILNVIKKIAKCTAILPDYELLMPTIFFGLHD